MPGALPRRPAIEATITTFNLELSDDNSLVTLEATATLPTTFMRIFGEEIMQVSARSEITRETKGLEVALVLDPAGLVRLTAGAGPGGVRTVPVPLAAPAPQYESHDARRLGRELKPARGVDRSGPDAPDRAVGV